jgi:hypothetical protein
LLGWLIHENAFDNLFGFLIELGRRQGCRLRKSLPNNCLLLIGGDLLAEEPKDVRSETENSPAALGNLAKVLDRWTSYYQRSTTAPKNSYMAHAPAIKIRDAVR